jgi:cytochrome c5
MKQMHIRIIVAALVFATAFAAQTSKARAQTSPATGKYVITKLTSTKITLPFGDRVFGGGKWAKVTNTRCLMCHSKGMVTQQPPMTQTAWTKEVEKMRKVYGCPMRDDQVDGVAQFIFKTTRDGH